MRVRALEMIVGLGALAAGVGCGNSNTPTYGGGGCTPTATQVCMLGSAFSPATLTITHGTTVTWKNGDGVAHTVTSATGSGDVYDSGNIASGGTFNHTFATAGTYNYYCKIHGADGGGTPTGMHAVITVN